MKKVLIFTALFLTTVCVADAQVLDVASYNIRYENKSDASKGNGWLQRCPVICNQIMFHDFDILGVQEVLKTQLDDMMPVIKGYAYIGVGREDGKEKGEYAPIFYKTDRFDLIDSGTFWLSENPDIPEAGWDAKYTRICTWGEFRDKVSGKKIWFFNTHFDHVGTQARIESAKLIISRIREMAGGDDAIITGDFNVDQNSPSYQELVKDGFLTDSYVAAPVKLAENGTVNAGFRVNKWTYSRIDHVLVTSGFRVLRYGVLTDLYWTASEKQTDKPGADKSTPGEILYYDQVARTPSDHYPVSVQLSY